MSFRFPFRFDRAPVSASRQEKVRVTVTYPAGAAPASLSYSLAMLPGNAPVAFNGVTDDAQVNNVFTYEALKNRTWLDGAGTAQKWGWGFAVPTGDYSGANASVTTYAQYKAMLAEGGNVALLNHGSHEASDGQNLIDIIGQNHAALLAAGFPAPRGAVRPASILGSVQAAVQLGYAVVQAEGFAYVNGAEGDGYGATLNDQDRYHQAYRLSSFLAHPNSLAIMTRAGFDNFVSDATNGVANAKAYFDSCVSYQAGAGVPLMFSFFTHNPKTPAQNPTFVGILDYLSQLGYPVLHSVQYAERLEVIKFAGKGEPVKSGNSFTFELDFSTLPAGTSRHDCTLVLAGGGYSSITVDGAETYHAQLASGLVEVYKRKGFGGLASAASAPANPGRLRDVVLPLDRRWFYQDNNIKFGVANLIDGNPATKFVPSDAEMLRPRHRIVCDIPAAYEAEVTSLVLYDSTGSWPETPNEFYATTLAGTQQLLGKFTGEAYEREVTIAPGSPVRTDQLTFFGQGVNNWPSELAVRGNRQEVVLAAFAPRPAVKFGKMLGVCVYDWTNTQDLNRAADSSQVFQTKMDLLLDFATAVRVFRERSYQEIGENLFAFEPVAGGWRQDLVTKSYSDAGVFVIETIMGIPAWMQAEYPADTANFGALAPVRYQDREKKTDPYSWRYGAKLMHDDAMRRGSNPSPDASVLSPLWANAPDYTPDHSGPQNVVKLSQGWNIGLEGGNELDGRSDLGPDCYLNAEEWYAKATMEYDGHNGLYPNHGVKVGGGGTVPYILAGQAVPFIDQVRVMGALAAADPRRGRRADGSINFPADALNVHLYANSSGADQRATGTHAVRVDTSDFCQQLLSDFIYVSDAYFGGIPVYVTETGCDWDSRSPLAALAYGSFSTMDVQAIITASNLLYYSSAGISLVTSYQADDDQSVFIGNGAERFVTCGMLNLDRTLQPDKSYRYIYSHRQTSFVLTQLKHWLAEWTFVRTVSQTPYVYEYARDGQTAYALTQPSLNDTLTPYELTLGAGYVLVTLDLHSKTATTQVLAAGRSTLTVTELPCLVMPA